MSLGFLESQRQGRKCYSEPHHLVAFVDYDRDLVEIEIRKELLFKVIALGGGEL